MAFDIAPFALPNTPAGELRFEEPREIVRLVAIYDSTPSQVRCEYLKKYWPYSELHAPDPLTQPTWFGWVATDDPFNSEWREAKADVTHREGMIEVTFRDMGDEEENASGRLYRKTMGVRLDPAPREMRIYTTGEEVTTTLVVDGGTIDDVEPYNAAVVENEGHKLVVWHMNPRGWDSGDAGLLTLTVGGKRFTVPLISEDPILFEGVYVRRESGPSQEEYEAKYASEKTLMARVAEMPDQTLGGALNGQPRAHRMGTNIGWPYSRSRFKVEPNADLYLNNGNAQNPPLEDTPRYKAKGQARFFFGFERWQHLGMWPDPAPVMTINHRFRRNGIECDVRSFAVPIDDKEELTGTNPTVGLARFRFRNVGLEAADAELNLGYSQESGRDENPYAKRASNEWQVPDSPMDVFERRLQSARGSQAEGCATYQLIGEFDTETVTRAVIQTTMTAEGPAFRETLLPGTTCDLILKVPFLAPTDEELTKIVAIHFDEADRMATWFWRGFCDKGARIQTPEPILNELHRAHAAHVAMTDFAMPDGLINTSVGTSTYGNYTNESVMIVRELDGRGLHEEAKRRLDLWIKYQGTAEQPGNFTDYEGMFFGAGGFEQGSYNQHHGWAQWWLCEHYWLTRDDVWLEKSLPAIFKGAEWIFRQRKNTVASLEHSRGWESGFMPAGSLEDVTDYHYWLVVNAVMWRAVEATARLLESTNHPEASRVRKETDAFRADLLKGFQTSREHSPLVQLRDGRWVPHDPSRLYRRGRDVGWIRETLEGSMYLVLTGLLDPRDLQTNAILQDYHDNRFTRPPYGYVIADFASDWYDRGGLSIQPNLLGTPDAHMMRDEPELFLWTFFNSWASCYREETNLMVEHPMPVLGYSNNAHFKTSDQANAIVWLRSILVWADRETLHFGRALPRTWLSKGATLSGAATRFGVCSVAYEGDQAVVEMNLHEAPKNVWVRFRLPEGKITSATVNDQPAAVVGDDVPLPSESGRYVVQIQR